MTDLPIRPAFWNVPLWGEIGVYILGLAAVAVCVWGIVRNVRLWKSNQPEKPAGFSRERLLDLIKTLFGQKKITRTRAGRLHFILSWGFFLLFCGTALATLDWDIGHYVFGNQFLRGKVYLAYKFILDCAGLGVLITLALGAARRWSKGSTLPGGKRFIAAYTSLAFIVLTGFFVEAIRLATTTPAWSAFSPVGHMLAQLLLAAGLEPATLKLLHTLVWTVHGIASLTFIAALPLTYYAHLYRTPSHIWVRDKAPLIAIDKIEDIEEQETFGISRFDQFTGHDRMAMDACTECGRCNDACPAVRAGTPLAPRNLVVKLRDRLHNPDGTQQISDLISHDELFSCTTCGACVNACPADIPLPEMIVRMRRHLALEMGEFPEGAAEALENTASVGNPWGLDPYERMDWARDLDVPVAQAGEHYDVLYWVGCAASYDRRARKIARAMVKILKAAKVNFAVMAEERCHGEFARRLGEEYLFQTAAVENIENFAQYSFDRILTACPHCFNTLKNEYPQFDDFGYTTVAHTVFIDELMREGRLPALAADQAKKTVYHDPCYLARMNGIVTQPRRVLAGARPDLVEAAECGKNALCCGAGGGQMWTDRHDKKPMNVIRLTDLRKTGAQAVAVSCPHCLTMLESAKSLDRSAEGLEIADIAELVAAALPEEKA